jgi:quercetin dioxygenase-like cupin family protein
MDRRRTFRVALGLFLAAAVQAERASATPSSGFTASTLAVGRLDDFEELNGAFLPEVPEAARARERWLSHQRVKGPSDLYVQSNVWAPGGTTGWHTHPGHSLIIVTEGTITAYEGGDPACTPRVYTRGMAFVDPGGEHVHVLRNEGPVEARTIAVQLIPAGATRRVDGPANAACRF